MTILHTEHHGATRIDVCQEWPSSGLHWHVHIPGGILPDFNHSSSGKFYQDAPGEKIHGATINDVIAHTARCARRFLKIE